MDNPRKDKEEYFGSQDRIGLNLLKNHIHFLMGDITTDNINEAIRWIVYENCNPGEKILTLYINSPGGGLNDAFALIDIMRCSKSKIRTIGIGSICSSAFLIFVAGTKGERYLSKTTSILSHQYSDIFEGKHHDLKSRMRESEFSHSRMLQVLEDSTNELDTKEIRSKLLKPTDTWLTVEDMIEYGLADHILN